MNRIALRIPSIIFHPLLIPVYGVLIILNSGTYFSYIPYEAKRLILLIYLISTIIIPLSSFPFLYYQKIIKSWDLSDNRQRVLPLLILSASHLFGWYLMGRLPIPKIYVYFIFFMGISHLIAAIISIKVKISIHLMTTGSIAGLILGLAFRNNIDMHFTLIFIIVAAALLIFSRLALNENRPWLMYSGLFLGFLIIYLPVVYL